jgi:hypothetical protein
MQWNWKGAESKTQIIESKENKIVLEQKTKSGHANCAYELHN